MRQQIGKRPLTAHAHAEAAVIDFPATYLADQAHHMGRSLRIMGRQPFLEQRRYFKGQAQHHIGRALRPGGRLVVLGANAAETAAMDVRKFYFGQYDLLGTTMGNVRDFASLLDLLADHRIPPPVIDRVFPLDEAADAHQHLETSRGFGKTVLEIA